MATDNKKYYSFYGDVLVFDRVHIYGWKAHTWAVSKSKASSNLKYQAKKELGLYDGSRIELDGTIKEVQLDANGRPVPGAVLNAPKQQRYGAQVS